jgi:hypothetical protein
MFIFFVSFNVYIRRHMFSPNVLTCPMNKVVFYSNYVLIYDRSNLLVEFCEAFASQITCIYFIYTYYKHIRKWKY